MKKFLTILCLAGLLSGCSPKIENSLPEPEAVTESATEITTTTLTQAVTTAAEKAVTTTAEKVTEPTTAVNADFTAFTELALAEPDSVDALNKRKTIFFTDNGYCYYAEIGGRDSANFVLSYDSGDGNYTPIENGEDCEWSFIKGNAIYGVKHYTRNANRLMSTICKYENGAITPIADIGYLSSYYFTDEYIYYCDDEKTVRRMDYNGKNIEEIAELGSVEKFAVHNGKIWYEKNHSTFVSKLMVYDTETKENTEVMGIRYSRGDLRFNGDHMYCIDNRLRLLRVNTDDYTVEVVCENTDFFDFCGEYIIYSDNFYIPPHGKLYRLSNDENTEIFNANDLLNQDYSYYINAVQCDDGHIFVEIMSGAFYSYVAELDINGNLIKKYYETKIMDSNN